MKRLIILITALVMICAQSPAQDNTKVKDYRYEGSAGIVSNMAFGYLPNLGVETTHGVRFLKDNLYIGATASFTFGLGLGINFNIGILPRTYYICRKKIEYYISLPFGFVSHAGGGVEGSEGPSSTVRQSYGIFFAPELGFGFKLKNNDRIDLAIKFQMHRDLWDDIYHWSTSPGRQTYPGIMIRYAF